MAGSGKYRTLRKIADGGMAEIFLALLEGEHGFEKLVVLKRIRPAFSQAPHFRNLLVDEAHIAMSLNHSNIVQVLDLGEAQGQYFLVLELVDGWSLAELVKRADVVGMAFDPQLALYAVAQTCRALSYAHAMTREGKPLGIVHRDVSPQNILVSERGEVKLTDFGIAKARNKAEHTTQGVVKGKLSFMSPEQTLAGDIDHRSDLFSLGTVLYFLVTHRLPFGTGTPIEVMARIQAGQFEPPAKVKAKVPSELNDLILKAMRTEPKERFRSAMEMLDATERVLRKCYPGTGQTELERWLRELHQRDGALPISRADENKTEPSGEWIEVHSSNMVPSPPHPDDLKFVRRRSPARWVVGAALLIAAVFAARSWRAGRRGPPAPMIASPNSEPPKKPDAVKEAPTTASAPLPTPAATIAPTIAPTPVTQAEPSLPDASVTDAARAEPIKEPAGAEPVKPEYQTVSVLVSSTPPGATIRIGPRTLGQTPMHVRFREDMSFELFFTKAGFTPVTRAVRVSHRKNQHISVTLHHAPQKKRHGR